jgi:hypothetical protein
MNRIDPRPERGPVKRGPSGWYAVVIYMYRRITHDADR